MIWSLKAGKRWRETEESLASGWDNKQKLACMSSVGWATVAEGGGGVF